jgi:hypothetical protein
MFLFSGEGWERTETYPVSEMMCPLVSFRIMDDAQSTNPQLVILFSLLF